MSEGKIGRFWKVLEWADHVMHWGPYVIGVAASAGAAGWAAQATDVLSQYAPFSWVFSGLVGAVLFMVVCWLWASVRLKLATRAYASIAASVPHSINPLRPHFETERIAIVDFFSIFFQINANKHFKDCEIHGPGSIVIISGHNAIDQCKFLGCDLVAFKGGPICTASRFSDATFYKCTFVNIVLFLPEAIARKMMHDYKDQDGKRLPIIGLD
jgi:hypothetical protein